MLTQVSGLGPERILGFARRSTCRDADYREGDPVVTATRQVGATRSLHLRVWTAGEVLGMISAGANGRCLTMQGSQNRQLGEVWALQVASLMAHWWCERLLEMPCRGPF